MFNILYLSYDGLTDPLGQSQILPYIKGLESKGNKFWIISFEKKDNYKNNKEKIINLLQNTQIKWIPLQYHKSPPIFSTLYDILQLKKIAKQVIKKENIEIVHCRSFVTSLVGLSLKKKLNIRFIFDMRGFWADERIEGRIWDIKNPIFKYVYGFFKQREKDFLNNADAVISLTENAKEEIESTFLSNDKLKTEVIPCCVDLQHFDPEKRSDEAKRNLRNKLGIKENEFVLLYLGSLGTWYMVEEMLDYYTELLKSVHQAKFLFLTSDQDLLIDNLERKQLSYSLFTNQDQTDFGDQQIIITQVSRDSVPEYINICDASIFFILPTFSKKASSATKMGEVLAMNKPVITNTGWGDVDHLLEGTTYGVVVKSFDTKGYQQAIEDLDYLLKRPENDIRQMAKSYYSLENGVSKYQKVYEKISGI